MSVICETCQLFKCFCGFHGIFILNTTLNLNYQVGRTHGSPAEGKCRGCPNETPKYECEIYSFMIISHIMYKKGNLFVLFRR